MFSQFKRHSYDLKNHNSHLSSKKKKTQTWQWNNVLLWRPLTIYKCTTRRNNTDLSWKTVFSTRSSTLPRAALHKLLEFANKKSHFLFDDQYYDQIDGVAMGSPLGPVLANIFICHFEERWVTKGQIRPSLWYRYVMTLSPCLRAKRLLMSSCDI